MPRRVTNDLLLGLLLAQVLTGLLGWSLALREALPLFDLHRALGAAILLALVWKQAIVLPSLRKRARRDRGIVWGSIAGIALLLTLGIGLAWTLGLISFDTLWGYSPMNIHVALGIGLLPFVAWHAVLRRKQNATTAPVRSRRTLLRVGGLALGTLVGWQAIQRIASVVDPRRETGSKPIASFSGNAYPGEIWLLDQVPALDASAWRLAVLGHVAEPGHLTLADVLAQPRLDVQTVLDCTSGWWTEQIWSGVSLRDVLLARGLSLAAQSVTVISVTGHTIQFALADLQDALLATHVGAEPLSPEHGYPVRLVVPGRRGYQWVKWVARIEVT